MVRKAKKPVDGCEGRSAAENRLCEAVAPLARAFGVPPEQLVGDLAKSDPAPRGHSIRRRYAASGELIEG